MKVSQKFSLIVSFLMVLGYISCLEGRAIKSFLADGAYPQDCRLTESAPMINGERHIVIVTCSYNNEEYYQWNLDSVIEQNYSNYHLLYVDDCSTDKTCDLVKRYTKENGVDDRVVLFSNEKRRRALANLYHAIHLCKPTDIIIILDGDDRFAHKHVLEKINQVYSDPNIWLTYGSFVVHPSGKRGFCKRYPKHIITSSRFRDWLDTPSHLRTFYAGLFHKIRKDDLLYKGEFFSTTYDLAIMFPMMEMARWHFLFIPEILVEYNGMNVLNDHRVLGGKELQKKCDLIIRSRVNYADVDNPFLN